MVDPRGAGVSPPLRTSRGATTVISVVMPFRDAGATIEGALTGLLAERDPPREVLCVDDGSTDGGVEVVRRVMRGDSRVVLASAGGVGVAEALAVGVARARHPLIARMDADDLSLPGRFAAQVDALAREPSVGVVGARVEPFGDYGGGTERYLAWMNALITPEQHARDRFVESPLCHPSVLMRREALDAAGGYRSVHGPEDWDLWLRVVDAGWSLAKVPGVFLRWRQHARSVTRASSTQSLEAMRGVRAPYLSRWLVARRRPVVVWGAGATGKRLARSLEPYGVRASGFVDIDPEKLGRSARGAPVRGVEALRQGEVTVVVAVGAAGARDEVRAWLSSRGWVDGEDYVAAS